MRNEFVESLRVNKNLNRTRNVYPISEPLSPKLKKIISAEEISASIQLMAEQIAKDYQGKNLALVCVEFGGKPFYNLLIDNLHSLGITNFYQGSVKMERGATKTTEDRTEAKFHFEGGIICDKNKLKDVHVLIVDDQISSGKTFDYLKERYSIAKSVELATFIVKTAAKKRLNDIKYYSFLIPSRNR